MINESQKSKLRKIKNNQIRLVKLLAGALIFVLPYLLFGFAPQWLVGAFAIYLLILFVSSIFCAFQMCPVCDRTFFMSILYWNPLINKCLHCGTSLKKTNN
jgi:hypothetical protein